MFEKDLSLSLLYDLYSPLLSEKKREVFEGYYLSDLSLAEIAADTGTTRQAVRDLIARTSAELSSYEEKLGLLEKRKRLVVLSQKLENKEGDQKEILDEIREIL
ncbi:MAG: DNA-binding protein [Clostridia bacterium]|nr:DNA-binding protein [Clostridia bacterium]